MGRNKIIKQTSDNRTFKYLWQDRIFYRETNRHCYKSTFGRCWKLFRKTQYK